ncbi:3-oxoacid CoA-transferase subunit B [Bacillus timonensis]|nr:3-oxoacid CoA-transferase subunit B [Bacillus timonensis]
MGMGEDVRHRIAKRAAQEIENGMIVNLGIGIPSLVPDYISSNVHVMIHAENGILGIGSSPKESFEDENLCNAAGYPVTIKDGGSYFDSSVAFGMIRKGYVDLTILGSLQVSEAGDLANWIVPGRRVPGMGGAMELAQKAKKVIVLMNHTNKNGESKIVTECSLPLTSKRCVNLIITEMAVIQVTSDGLFLTDIMYPYSIEEIIEKTDAPLTIAENPSIIY